MPEIFSKTLEDLHSGNARYIIPPYQRTITWPETQWKALFQDVIDAAEDPNKKHLFQIFQFRKTVHNDEVEVGDGQQRLVQTSLLLAALAYKVNELQNDTSLPPEILSECKDIVNSILPFKDDFQTNGLLSFGIKRKERKPRIKVAYHNREFYEAIMLWEKENPHRFLIFREDDIVISAFRFYLEALTNYLTDKNIERKMGDIVAILRAVKSQLVFAVSYFDKDEDMQASYEATNSRGVPLADVELVKNHMFQEFTLTEQEDLVKKYWSKYDSGNYWINKPTFYSVTKKKANSPAPSTDNLNELLKYDTVSRDFALLDTLKTYKVFDTFKTYHAALFELEKQSAKVYYKEYLTQLLELASLYERFMFRTGQTNPSNKPTDNPPDNYSFTVDENRYWEFYQRFAVGFKAKELGFILLIALLRTYKTRDAIEPIMELIESYALRKMLVSQAVRNTGDIFLPMILQKMSPREISNRLLLKADSVNRWESDETVIEALKNKAYKNHNRLFTLLNIDYENSQKNVKREYSQKIEYKDQSLEHFMPQNPANPEITWPLTLPDGITREDLTYNFGNFLLLPGLVNSEVGNWGHIKKVAHFRKDSNELGITGILSVDKVLSMTTWDYDDIMNECEIKSHSILKKYVGPEKTVKATEVKTQLDLGKIKVGQNVFIDLVNGQSAHVGQVDAAGFIRLIDNTTSDSIKELKKNTYKDVSENKKTIRFSF